MWRLFEENLVSEYVMLFLQRALKDLSQPKTEWNFPTEARGRSKKLISYELIL